MENKLTNALAIITKEIVSTGIVELMYYDIKDNEISLNVVTITDIINIKAEKFLEIVKICEAIKERLAEKGINLKLNIRSTGTYSRDDIEVDKVIYADETVTKKSR